jgi:hypothetical protein
MGEGEPSCRRELEQQQEEEEEIIRQAYKYREKITSCGLLPCGPNTQKIGSCSMYPTPTPTTTNLPHINRMTGYIYIGVQFLAAPVNLGTTIMPPNWMVTGFLLGKLQKDTGYCT